MAIVKDLYDRKKAVLMVQGDQRRWPALERISRMTALPVVEGKEVRPTSFDLKLYAAFDTHIQAALVRDILKTIKNPEATVVVLPDPEALIPLLSEIAPVVSAFNVSMGYPLQRSSLSSLFYSVGIGRFSKRWSRISLRVSRNWKSKIITGCFTHTKKRQEPVRNSSTASVRKGCRM